MMRISSQVLSYLINPLLLTTVFGYLLAEQFPVIMVPSPLLTNILLGVLFVVTFVLPVISLLMMQKMGIISDLMISERVQRTVPLLYTSVIYIAAGVVIFRDNRMNNFHISELLFLVAGLMVIAGGITRYWKISAHALGVGGVVGVLCRLVFSFYGIEYIYALIIALLLSGLVMSARLYLGAHSLTQVLVGFALGGVYAYVTSLYIL